MPKFRGEISFTMTVTATVECEYEHDQESEDFDEDALSEKLLEEATEIGEKLSDLLDDNYKHFVEDSPTISDVRITDDNFGEVNNWEQLTP